MVLLTVEEDGRIEIPMALRERLGLLPGSRVILDEEEGLDSIRLRVLVPEARLVEKDGAWVIRSGHRRPGESEEDWVARVREERIASLSGE